MQSRETVEDIVASLKKEFGNANLTTLGKEAHYSRVPYWVKTGSTLLDCAVNQGLPGGRIIEISGKSAAGKSCLAFHAIADVQRQGGIAVLLDTEASADTQFASICGVDIDQLILAQPDTVEELYTNAELMVQKLHEQTEGKIPVLIVADSCTAPTEGEAEKNLVEAPKIAHNAVVQRRGLRKLVNRIVRTNVTFIGINHLVADPMAMFGPKQVSTGGSAWSYFPAVRIQLTIIGKIKSKIKGGGIGVNIKAVVTKNKCGPPDKAIEFPIYYDRGIDDVISLVDFGRINGLFGITKGWIEYEDKKYRRDDFIKLIQENKDALEWLTNECKVLLNEVE